MNQLDARAGPVVVAMLRGARQDIFLVYDDDEIVTSKFPFTLRQVSLARASGLFIVNSDCLCT